MPSVELVTTDLTGPLGERVLIRRSARRRRTVSISRDHGDLIVAVPASLSRRREQETVRRMLDQFTASQERRAPAKRSDAQLAALAAELSETHLGGRAHPVSITWSSRQNRRWGSCTPSEGTIRISDRLQGMPDWVVRAVVHHELVHLLVPGHGPDFQALMARYPESERASGFLDGISWAQHATAAERERWAAVAETDDADDEDDDAA
ncbi:SprT-like domain-containing protein [Brachybacterium sp. DNPG3]